MKRQISYFAFLVFLFMNSLTYAATLGCLGYVGKSATAETGFSNEIDISGDVAGDPNLFKTYPMIAFGDLKVELTVNMSAKKLLVAIAKPTGSISILGNFPDVEVTTGDQVPGYMLCGYIP